ncbi:MAG TPA: DUF488 domain-containing protein [Bryobacteraceae bacterium]|nr:DUF488 domain-containing protein [Bryobacteraceae bacterium]
MRRNRSEQRPISTIGHSTHGIEEFIELLKEHQITQLIDVRTIPRSRHNPQFNREKLPYSLQAAGIAYRHMPGLGGLRRAQADSINTGWRNASFRGFADYMQTPEFRNSLQELIDLAAGQPTAVMCAEAVPWRCHRSLIADALVARGIPVLEILSATQARPHAMTPFARVDGAEVTYPKGGKEGTPKNLKLRFDGPDPMS